MEILVPRYKKKSGKILKETIKLLSNIINFLIIQNLKHHRCSIIPNGLFYFFIVSEPILRHLGKFGKIRLLPGENRLLPGGGDCQYRYPKEGL